MKTEYYIDPLSGLKFDAVENTEKFKKIVDDVDKEVFDILKEQFNDDFSKMSENFSKIKKQILKEKYNIDWKSAKELNF